MKAVRMMKKTTKTPATSSEVVHDPAAMSVFQKDILNQIAVLARTKKMGNVSLTAGRRWVRSLCKLLLDTEHMPTFYASEIDGTLGLTLCWSTRSLELTFATDPSAVYTEKMHPKCWTALQLNLPETDEDLLAFWKWISCS